MRIARMGCMGAILVTLAVGCQNKLYEENRALRMQQQETQARLSQMESERAQVAAIRGVDGRGGRLAWRQRYAAGRHLVAVPRRDLAVAVTVLAVDRGRWRGHRRGPPWSPGRGGAPRRGPRPPPGRGRAGRRRRGRGPARCGRPRPAAGPVARPRARGAGPPGPGQRVRHPGQRRAADVGGGRVGHDRLAPGGRSHRVQQRPGEVLLPSPRAHHQPFPSHAPGRAGAERRHARPSGL